MTFSLSILSFNIGLSTTSIPSLLSFATQHKADFICLQEVPPAIETTIPDASGYSIVSSTNSDRGVAILFHTKWKRLLIDVWDHSSNRAIAISFRTTNGTLFVSSIYLPTNLSHYPTSSITFQSTLSLMNELISKSQSSNDSIICGDLNEDDNCHRQQPNKCRIVELLRNSNLIDTHRTVHNQECNTDSLNTYFYSNRNGPSCSRLDYIWLTPNLFSNLDAVETHTESSAWGIDTTSRRRKKHQNHLDSSSSRRNFHSVLSTTLNLDHSLLPTHHQQLWPQNTPYPPRTSNRHATVRFFFAHACHTQLTAILPKLSSLLSSPDLNLQHLQLAINSINDIISHNATVFYGVKRHFDRFDTPNIKKIRAVMMNLNSLRRKLMIILKMIPSHLATKEYATSPLGPPSSFDDRRIHSHCSFLRRAGITTPSSINQSQWKQWLTTTLPTIYSDLRHQLRLEFQSLGTITDDQFLMGRKPFYQKCFKGAQTCSISSIHDPQSTSTLLTNPKSIASTLSTHFHNLFNGNSPTSSSSTTSPTPTWLLPRTDIKQEWYDDLMINTDTIEVTAIIKDMNQHSAAGCDGIAIRMVQEIIEFETSKPLHPNRVTIPSNPPFITEIDNTTTTIMSMLVNACLQLGDLPPSLKLSTLCPIPKQGKSINSISNIRPISIQPALTRIIMALLAKRLTSVLSKHSILDKAQEAFLQGGNIHNCIRAITSVWHHRLQHKRSCYSLFYDIAKAYDTTPWSSIKLSLQRICLPPAFINFTISSLQNSSFRIRLHPHHLSDHSSISQSVKQGDPLSPLLFIIVMDPLHFGYRRFKGYTISDTLSLQSVGYADDTCINAESFDELVEMNDWTLEFFRYHGFKLQPKKCILVGLSSDGAPLSTSITIDGQKVLPSDPFKPIRYLGALLTMNLSWTPLINELHGTVYRILLLIRQYPLTCLQSKYMVNECLHPKLETGFRHAIIPKEKLAEWDVLLAKALFIKTNSFGSCHISYVSTCLQIKTFQALYDACHISDFYITLNDSSFCGTYLRSTFSSQYPLDHNLYHATKLMRDNHLQLARNPSSLLLPISSFPPMSSLPIPSTLWTHSMPSSILKAYTDGSTTQCMHEHLTNYSSRFFCTGCKPRSGSGVVVISPQQKSISHQDGFNFRIPVVDNYFAELAPILQCHFSLPLTININLLTDSLSNIKSIENFRKSPPPHYQMYRIHCWPLLNLIAYIDKIRMSHGGSLSIDHITAHQDRSAAASPSTQLDIDGNSTADQHAKMGASTSSPLWPIPIEWGMGPYVLYGPINGQRFFPIYTDIRGYILERHRWTQISLWNNKSRGSRSEILTHFLPHQRGQVLSLINMINKTKDSKLMSMCISSLTQSIPTRRALWHQKKSTDDKCLRCNSSAREDTLHVFLCPENEELKINFFREIRVSIKSTDIEQVIRILSFILFNHPNNAPFHILTLLLGNLPSDIQSLLNREEQQKLVCLLHSLAKNIYEDWSNQLPE